MVLFSARFDICSIIFSYFFHCHAISFPISLCQSCFCFLDKRAMKRKFICLLLQISGDRIYVGIFRNLTLRSDDILCLVFYNIKLYKFLNCCFCRFLQHRIIAFYYDIAVKLAYKSDFLTYNTEDRHTHCQAVHHFPS